MKATIWHNPRCSKSREALAILRETPGIELQVIEYLSTPPTAAVLASLYARAEMSVRDGLRKAEPGAKALAGAGDEAILAAMADDPILIERPLVETAKGVRLARPPERVREIL
ncbi:arsenate reductase family protein [Sphingomonas aracearum]|uniref:Arsenate reductase n=1 Tax=Sphingomonas aracearum TaxID=2283317 RepID=A0A369VSY8_9SPHN|nr:arsenate reductase family protein [Sphingomonas aracearum]RDE05498.1 arsenate reductase family protein [Sphingomonas aracearum]